MATGEQPIGGWLEELGSRSPTPGGGSAAALSAATAAALVQMVANYTTGSRWADREDQMRRIAGEAAGLRAGALEAADADAVAFGSVTAAYRLPKATPPQQSERSARIQQALVEAAAPPARVGRLAARVAQIAADLAGAGNPNVVSDVAVAASAARAALEGAIVNIEINRRQIRDEAEAGRLARVVAELEAAAEDAGRVVAAVRGGLRA